MKRTPIATVIILLLAGPLCFGQNPADQPPSSINLFDGQTLGQWKSTDFFGQGEVSIKDEAIILGRGNDMTGITWTGPVMRQNYEINLQAKRLDGSDFFCGLTFPVGDEYCSLICGGWGGSLLGISSIDYYDAANNSTSTSFDFEDDRWYHIRIRVTEYMLQVWIDAELKIDLNTKEHHYSVRFEVEESRPLGIATWQTTGAVRNISMHEVESFPRFAPTYTYRSHEIEGWRVWVSDLLDVNHPALTKDTLRLLTKQLQQINRTVPKPALKKLKTVKIWVEYEDRLHPGMCYHPNKEWLIAHGYNPDKTGSVELANAANFLKWSQAQPWMVLHELAHAYHHKVLGHGHPDIKKAFEQAKQSGIYKEVLDINGKKKPHYALNNDKEYFAESSEAYFGKNDFYPFVRAELKQHDPNMFALMEQLWNLPGKTEN